MDQDNVSVLCNSLTLNHNNIINPKLRLALLNFLLWINMIYILIYILILYIWYIYIYFHLLKFSPPMTPPPPELDYEGSWEHWQQFQRIIHALKHVLYQDIALGNVHTCIKKTNIYYMYFITMFQIVCNETSWSDTR